MIGSFDRSPRDLAVSPDGQQVALTRIAENASVFNERDVWVMNLDGSGLRQLTDTKSTIGMGEGEPAWSPDGQWIMLVRSSGDMRRFPKGAGSDIFALPATSVQIDLAADEPEGMINIRRLTRPYLNAVTSQTFSILDYPITWLPPAAASEPGSLPKNAGTNRGLTGTLYYRGGRNSENDRIITWALDLTSATLTPLPETITSSSGVSMDGLEFAQVQTDIDQGEASVIIVRDDGSEVVRFSKSYYLAGPVRVSPDGQSLAFHADFDAEPGSLFTEANILVTTREGAPLAQFPGFFTYDWLPDGSLILGKNDGFYRNTSNALNILTRLFTLTDPVNHLRVSPDGQQLAFFMANRIWTSALDGSDLQRLTESKGLEATPAWSPDGRFIAFRKFGRNTDDVPPYLWVVAADAQAVRITSKDVSPNAIAIQHLKDNGELTDAWSYTAPSWQ